MIGKFLCRLGFHSWSAANRFDYTHCRRCGIKFSEWANKEYGAH